MREVGLQIAVGATDGAPIKVGARCNVPLRHAIMAVLVMLSSSLRADDAAPVASTNAPCSEYKGLDCMVAGVKLRDKESALKVLGASREDREEANLNYDLLRPLIPLVEYCYSIFAFGNKDGNEIMLTGILPGGWFNRYDVLYVAGRNQFKSIQLVEKEFQKDTTDKEGVHWNRLSDVPHFATNNGIKIGTGLNEVIAKLGQPETAETKGDRKVLSYRVPGAREVKPGVEVGEKFFYLAQYAFKDDRLDFFMIGYEYP